MRPDLFSHHLDLAADRPTDPRALPAVGGVYLVTDASDRPILLACGENLRRIVIHRLAAPPADRKSKRAQLADVAARLWWRPTFSRFETALVHWRIARTLFPRDYRKRIGFGPAWFLRVDPGEHLPRFTAVREFRHDAARYAGPFPTRRSAEGWIHMLEDMFDLCRYYDVLEQTPAGRPCAYFEMGRCPAPCDGSLPLPDYRRMTASALAFTLGDHYPRRSALRQSMQTAAHGLAYEKAASIRQTLDRADALIQRPGHTHVTNLRAARWLVIQRAGPARRAEKSTLVKPFFLCGGALDTGEPAAMTDLAAAVPRWIETGQTLSPPPPASREDETTCSERLWLLSRFLFAGDRAPGLFLRLDQLPDSDTLLTTLHDRFRARRPTPPAE